MAKVCKIICQIISLNSSLSFMGDTGWSETASLKHKLMTQDMYFSIFTNFFQLFNIWMYFEVVPHEYP